MSERSDFLSFMQILDETLLTVLVRSSRNSMLSDQPHAISTGVFLCEMYRHFPDQVSVFFENPGRFQEIGDKLAPRSVPGDVLSSSRALAERMKLRWEALRKSIIGDEKPFPMATQGRVAALDVCVSSSLVTLFQRTSALAIEGRHRSADVHDLMKALAADETLAGELCEETGLILKGSRNR